MPILTEYIDDNETKTNDNKTNSRNNRKINDNNGIKKKIIIASIAGKIILRIIIIEMTITTNKLGTAMTKRGQFKRNKPKDNVLIQFVRLVSKLFFKFSIWFKKYIK